MPPKGRKFVDVGDSYDQINRPRDDKNMNRALSKVLERGQTGEDPVPPPVYPSPTGVVNKLADALNKHMDTMEKLPTNSRNQAYAQFQAARNSLYDQILDAASKLEPGEDMIIGDSNGLCIQVRRVNDERENIVADDANPFVKVLQFV